MLVKLVGVGKEFAGEWLFRDIHAQVNPGERIGLVGRNGVGKTTLFRIIEGSLEPDAGRVERRRDLQVVRIEQTSDATGKDSLFAEVVRVFEPLRRLEAEAEELERRMASGDLTPETAHRYEEIRHRLRLHGGYDYAARTEAVLFGLGFSREDLERPLDQLSGGQRRRAALARALLRPAHLLLLDEPTNHLDIRGILWLEEFLQKMPEAVVVISHDRHFLDHVTQATWEIEGGRLWSYPAAYTSSRELRRQRMEQEWEAWRAQQEWKERTEEFIRRNIAGQNTRQAQSRLKMLERAEWLEPPPVESEALSFRVPEAPRGPEAVITLEDTTLGFPGTPLLRGVSLAVRRGDRVGIVGPNGSGKTTLLRTLVGDLPVLGGRIQWGHGCLPAYYAQEPDLGEAEGTVFDYLAHLHPARTDQELRGVAACFGFRGEEVFKGLASLSGGERSRLQLLRLFTRPCNVLFLDEPTNHLDIPSREILERALAEFGGTLVMVSHDLAFLGRLAERFWWVEGGRVEEYSSLARLEEALAGSRDGRERAAPSEARAARRREARDEAGSAEEKRRLSKNERMRLEWRRQELEERIHELEERRSEVLRALSAGEADHAKLHAWAEEAARLEQELADSYREWEELVDALDA
ncbi:MAG: ABC-F family ATP-binding cassette domain-containing protein [Acidobacteriota bacterium]